MDKDVIFSKVKELMISEFNLDADSIALKTLLDDELQLDSLDMVDLILCLKDHLGKKIDPTIFKNAKTVQDVVDSLYPIWE